MARYLLQRVGEDFKVDVSFAPKLFKDWNGSGCHTNYSTKEMRTTGGKKYIEDMMTRLGEKQREHMLCYGEGNDERLTGIHETSSMDKFTWGVGNRAASVRIPTSVANNNYIGYIEDRRPASNICPYLVCSLIADTTLIKESKAGPMLAHVKDWFKWRKTQNWD